MRMIPLYFYEFYNFYFILLLISQKFVFQKLPSPKVKKEHLKLLIGKLLFDNIPTYT